MLSKNNFIEKERKITQNANRFTLRKLNVGLCSVLIGASFMCLNSNVEQVKADIKSDQQTEVDQKTDSSVQNLQEKQVTLDNDGDSKAVKDNTETVNTSKDSNADIKIAKDSDVETKAVKDSEEDINSPERKDIDLKESKDINVDSKELKESKLASGKSGDSSSENEFSRENDVVSKKSDDIDQIDPSAVSKKQLDKNDQKRIQQENTKKIAGGLNFFMLPALPPDPAPAEDPVNVSDWDFQRQSDGILLDGFHGTITDRKLIVPNSYDFTQVGVIREGQKVYIGKYFSNSTTFPTDNIHGQHRGQITDFAISHNGNGKVIAQGGWWSKAFSGLPYKTFDLTNLDVSQFKGMDYMFSEDPNLEKVIGLDKWKIGNVNSLVGMFKNDNRLTSVGDLSQWQTGNVKNMQDMFSNCRKLTTVGDLSNWNVSQVTSMYKMFNECRKLTSVGLLKDWKTGNVTNMFYMFRNAMSLKQLDMSNWNTSKVTNMSYMFGMDNLQTALTSLGDLSHWKVGNVTNFEGTFSHLASITSLGDLSHWDVGKATNMQVMFYEMVKLQSLGNLGSWNTSNVSNFIMTFMDDHSLTGLGDIYKWDMTNVTHANAIFCRTGMTDIDIHGWNLANNTDTSWMFAYNLKPLLIDMRGVTLPRSTNFTILSFYSDQPMVVYADENSPLLALNTAHYNAYDWVGNTNINVTGHQNTNIIHIVDKNDHHNSFDIPVDFVFSKGKDDLVKSLKQATEEAKVNALVQKKFPDASVAESDFDSKGSLKHDYNLDPLKLIIGVYPVDLEGPAYTQKIIYKDEDDGTEIDSTKLQGHLSISGTATIEKDALDKAIDDHMPANYYYVSGKPTADLTINSTTPTDIVILISNKANVDVKYETSDGTVVKTETVDGTVGSEKTIDFTAPENYQLAEGQSTSKDFTFSRTNDPIIVHVTTIPVSASVDIKYETLDGTVVKTDLAKGNVGDTITLNFIAPTGYQLAKGQISSEQYKFTGEDKPIIVKVKAIPDTNPKPKPDNPQNPPTPGPTNPASSSPTLIIPNQETLVDNSPKVIPKVNKPSENHAGQTVVTTVKATKSPADQISPVHSTAGPESRSNHAQKPTLGHNRVVAKSESESNAVNAPLSKKRASKLPQTGSRENIAMFALGGAALLALVGLAVGFHRHE